MDFLVNLDGNILLWIQEYIRQDWMDGFWKGITTLGNSGGFWILLSAVLLLFKPTRKTGLTALLALVIGALITNVTLKPLVARIRPYEVVDGLILLIERQGDFSFPSGHTCASFAAAMVYWKRLPEKWKAWGIASLVLAGLIAFSRLYVGVHYPTDVLCGMLIGIGAGYAAVAVMDWAVSSVQGKKKTE